jgi:hypothetical protein
MSRFLQIMIAISSVAFATPSFAQATRTWVSGVGDDANPCSRTAPCKTFAGAISKTLAGGEINCLDPGGFGAVTITKSITIDCTGTFGSILNSGTTGVLVNDSATATPDTIEVILRGLTIDGAGTVAGLNGIRFLRGRSLVLEDVFIQNETGGNGIVIQPAGFSEFYAENVTVTDGAVGILMQPTGAAGALRAELRNVRAQNNSGTGLRIDANNSSSAAGTNVLIDKSSVSGNADGIVVVSTVASRPSVAMITDSNIFANSGIGVIADGQSARVRVGNSTITRNGTGVSITNSANILTYGTNRLDGNATASAFTSPAIPQQ